MTFEKGLTDEWDCEGLKSAAVSSASSKLKALAALAQNMGDATDPTHPDYVEDYDFFAVKRKERLIAISEAKKKIDAQARVEIKKKALKWRDNGTSALQAVKSGVSGIRFLLEPHNNTKKTVMHFNSQVEFLGRKIQGTLCCRNCYPLAAKVLQVSRADPHGKYRWFSNKANLIEWKSNLMSEVRSDFRDKHPFAYEYRPRYADVRLMRCIFRSQMNLIPIDRSISDELKKKRAHYKVVTTKLKLIHDTQHACEMISHCKSRQHSNPKGCSNCGVRYIGGMLDGGVPYVQSISRDTGLISLVTLEFEVETLIEENIVQTEIVERVEIDLFAYEEVVLSIVRVNIQAWWSVVLVWKRYKRRQRRIEKSLYLHRIRRLVMMKREIDRSIREAPPLDMERYSEAYCDMLPALREYAELQVRLKEERILKWAKQFRVNLIAKVEITRDRKYREYLRLLALPKPPRPIVIKKFEITEMPQLVCYRLECKMRKFLSKERYEIHMNVHHKEDLVKYQIQAKNKQAKTVRESREQKVLHRIADSRHRLELYNADEHSGAGELNSHPQDANVGLVPDTTLTMSQDDASERSEQESEQQFEEGGSLGLSQELSQLSLSSDLISDSELIVATNDEYSHLAQTVNPYALVVDTNMNTTNTNANNTQRSDTSEHPSSATAEVMQGEKAARHNTGFAKKKVLPLRSPVSSTSPSREKSHRESNQERDHAHHMDHATSTASSLVKLSLASPKTKTSAQDLELYQESAQSVEKWAAMTHIYALHSMLNDSMFSLELVSKQGDISVAQRVPLDRPLIRIGTHSSCECVVTASGAAKRDCRVAKIHCLLYCPTHKGSTFSASYAQEEEVYGGTAKAAVQANSQLTLVDNTTAYGTYVVSAQGTRKAPVKITAGIVLTAGMLVCIGVVKDGPNEIAATEANQACIVYRVRCLDQELA